MVKKHKFYLSFVLAVLLIIPCMVLFAGCGNNTINNFTNKEMGITVDGGKFEKGSELSVEKYENDSQAGQEALTRIASYSYSTAHEPIIYDIKVTKDDATIQPNGAITITMNAPYESTNGFVVFHIVDESTIETPEVTYANGKISFSVTHFSVFIVAEEDTTVNNFIFKLELELNEENDDVVKSVEYYTTGGHDGKSAQYKLKVNGEDAESVNTTIDANNYSGEIIIKSSTAYKIYEKGTIDQQNGVLGSGFYTHDGSFGGKININPNYKLFWLQKLESSNGFSLVPVEARTMQVLNEGQYIVVRKDVYDNAVAQGLSNDNGDLCETIVNLIIPKDSGKGDDTTVIADITAAYVFTIQINTPVKNA